MRKFPAILRVFRAFSRPLGQRDWFIRVTVGKTDSWDNGKGNSSDLASHAFTKSDEPVSVFSVSSDEEEARVVSALQATKGQTPSPPILALRFSRIDVLNSGLVFIKTNGETGIHDVDEKHFDILGTPSQFATLTLKVLYGQRAGQMRVRRLGKGVLAFQMKTLSEGAAGKLSANVQEKCEKLRDTWPLEELN